MPNAGEPSAEKKSAPASVKTVSSGHISWEATFDSRNGRCCAKNGNNNQHTPTPFSWTAIETDRMMKTLRSNGNGQRKQHKTPDFSTKCVGSQTPNRSQSDKNTPLRQLGIRRIVQKQHKTRPHTAFCNRTPCKTF